MPLGIKRSTRPGRYYHSSPGVWVNPSDHRAEAKRRDLGCPGARRRRALSILLLIRSGVDPQDIAVWYHLSPQRVGQLARAADRFGKAVLHG